jgi:hypothetical protein
VCRHVQQHRLCALLGQVLVHSPTCSHFLTPPPPLTNLPIPRMHFLLVRNKEEVFGQLATLLAALLDALSSDSERVVLQVRQACFKGTQAPQGWDDTRSPAREAAAQTSTIRKARRGCLQVWSRMGGKTGKEMTQEGGQASSSARLAPVLFVRPLPACRR